MFPSKILKISVKKGDIDSDSEEEMMQRDEILYFPQNKSNYCFC